ncbi:Forkhead associated (FHA) domain, binds pSer, pThr, pTyr [Geosmithia morbida]|uniref:Forkhead associated (FHA) domain, binds pSer, pThr, pTyr n=1 Tax=Geosmithia morbida TaxID=1094350 RepID=A0A9P5D0E9_9HYPO|nr:Forkhead associated (FHA) domain, binds pSer, pThr, pTyr [Geosmithia morbida]KAF4122658.1 Forkhead associated (FHA) domain, binds pSer, pThr, pTyr [Geosmithia morbida]
MSTSSPSGQQEVIVRLNTLSNTTAKVRHRRIVLSKETPVVSIGRTSKRRSLFEAAETNGYFDCPVMSRHHAELRIYANMKEVVLEDVGSLHGTYQNGTRLATRIPRILYSGDIVTFGMSIDRGSEKFSPYEVKVDIDWRHSPPQDKPVTYRVPDESDVEDESDDDDGVEMSYSKQVMQNNNFRPAHLSEFAIDLISNPSEPHPSDSESPCKSAQIMDLTSDEVSGVTTVDLDEAPEEEPVTKSPKKSSQETPVPGAFKDYDDGSSDDNDDDDDGDDQSSQDEQANEDDFVTDNSDSSPSSDSESDTFPYEEDPFSLGEEDQAEKAATFTEYDEFSVDAKESPVSYNPWVSSSSPVQAATSEIEEQDIPDKEPVSVDEQAKAAASTDKLIRPVGGLFSNLAALCPDDHRALSLGAPPTIERDSGACGLSLSPATPDIRTSLPAIGKGFQHFSASPHAGTSSTAEALGSMTGKIEAQLPRDAKGSPGVDPLTAGAGMHNDGLGQPDVNMLDSARTFDDVPARANPEAAEKPTVQQPQQSNQSSGTDVNGTAPATIAPSTTATKRKADEISAASREEKVALERAQYRAATDPAQDSAKATEDAPVPAPEATMAVEPRSALGSVTQSPTAISTSHDMDRPTKRFRRAVEVIGYAAIGGAAVVSALIMTAPAL